MGLFTFATNAQQHAYDMEKEYAQEYHDTVMQNMKNAQEEKMAGVNYGYDKALAEQSYGYDTALSAQNAKQELEKQMQQQSFDKEMASTEYQRKVADMQAAGINPALANGGVSTATGTGAQQATAQVAQTNARQNEKQAKANILGTLATAFQTGILQVATKKIVNMSKTLAKNPNNKKLKNNLKSYIYNTYNLMK